MNNYIKKNERTTMNPHRCTLYFKSRMNKITSFRVTIYCWVAATANAFMHLHYLKRFGW